MVDALSRVSSIELCELGLSIVSIGIIKEIKATWFSDKTMHIII
jgi:hypothetical protein